MHNKTTIIFDFFGTLVDYTPGSFTAKKRNDTYRYLVSKRFSWEYEEFAARVHTSYELFRTKASETQEEFSMTDVIQQVLQQELTYPVNTALVEEVTTLFLDEWRKDVRMFPNIHSFLNSLSQKYNLAIISNTNNKQLIPTILKEFKMDSYFSHITTSIEHGKRKPHPAIFSDTLAAMQIEVGDVIFVGDNYAADYLGPKNLGIKCFLIDPNNVYPQLGEERIISLFDLENQL